MKPYKNSTLNQKLIIAEFNRIHNNYFFDMNVLCEWIKSGEAEFPGTNEDGTPVLFGCVKRLIEIRDAYKQARHILAPLMGEKP